MKKGKKEIESQEVKKNSKIKKIIIITFFILIICSAIKIAFLTYKWQTIAVQMLENKPSQVIDSEKNVIAQIGGEKKRKNVTFSEIPDNLKNAYVAIEDERFYKHAGVDIKRTLAAIGSYIIHRGNSSFGASTITQQVVKNLTGDDSNSISRKVKEWGKATALEWCLSKDEILEGYLNIIYVGPNVYGVAAGSKYYFNKDDVKDLSLAECAFLAGINNSPNAYNPYNKEKDNSEKIEKRSKTVLNKMLELEYITEDEYNEAIEEIEDGFEFKKGNIETLSDGVYSYHTDALISDVISDIANKNKMSNIFATNYLNMANLRIYSTQNTQIQKIMEKEFEKSKYSIKSNIGNENSQAAMVIIDNSTGYVVGCVGGLGEKKEVRGFNRAVQAKRQTGSSSKLIAVIAPALAEKIITPVTSYLDEETVFIDNNNEEYSPTDYNEYKGEITVRRAVESSQNIPFVKIMEQLTPEVSIKYLKKLGITTLTERDANLALALGGLDKGISPLEMAGAYSAIANNGKYVEPVFYTEITTKEGNRLLKSKPKTRRVFSEAVSYITKQLMTEPVIGANGTANYCKIPGMDVAAKTGTTNEDFDRWLCGFTNYYTAVTWFGFDIGESIRYNSKNPAGLIWSAVMNSIHKELKNSEFEIPVTVICKKICKKSGKIANTGCNDTYEEYFIKGNIPGICPMHRGTELVDVVNNNKDKLKNIVKDTMESLNSETKIQEKIQEEGIDSKQENVQEEAIENELNIQEETNTVNNEITNNDIPNNEIIENDKNEVENINEQIENNIIENNIENNLIDEST